MYSVDFDNGITIEFDKEPTPEQINEAYSQYQKSQESQKKTFGAGMANIAKNLFSGKVGQAVENIGTGIKNIISDVGQTGKTVSQDVAQTPGLVELPFTSARATRDITSGAGRVVGATGLIGLKTIYDLVTPEKAKQEGAQAIQDLAQTKTGQAISNTIYNFAQNNPTIANEISKTLDIANLALPQLRNPITNVARNVNAGAQEIVSPALSGASQLVKRGANAAIDSVPTISNSPRAASFLTNVDQEVFKRVANSPEYAQKVLKSSDEIIAGGTNPYFSKAEELAGQFTTAETETKNLFKSQIKQFTDKNQRFDVGARVNEIIDSVDDFRTGKDIQFTQLRNKDGSLGAYKITKGQFSPYSTEEIVNLNSLVNDIRSAKNITADQLIALDQKIASYYNRVPLGANQTPTPYHAAVMQLKEATESRISDLLPDSLKVAYEKYASLNRAKSAFISKIVDEQGNVRTTAESFLSNLLNKNKGQIQKTILDFEKATGINLLDDVQAIRDAIALSQVNPATGSRISDILKATMFTGGGATLGSLAGPGGAVAGATTGTVIGSQLTSPRVIGQRILRNSAGRLRNPLLNN